MISTFARLKGRLLWNVLKHGQGLGLVLFSVLAAILSGSATLSAQRADLADLTLALPLLAFGLVMASVLSPLLFGSTDETVDTTRLALFPLDTRRLAVGMGTAALVGPGPLALAVPLVALAARAPGAGPTIVAIAAALTLVTLVAVLPKLVMTTFGALLRRRRSRDIATIASSLLIAALLIGVQAGIVIGGNIDRGQVQRAADVAEVLPTGWPTVALRAALEGRVWAPLFYLGASWILLAYLLLSWARILERSLSEVDEGGEAQNLAGHLLRGEAHGPGTNDQTVERPTRRFLPSSFLGWAAERESMRPVLAKEWRYLKRHPRYRVQVISQALVVFIGGAPFIGAVLDRRPEAVLLGCVPGLTAGLTGANLLGPDGRALWAEAIALPSLRPLLRGRSLVFATIGVAGSVLVTLGSAAYTGGWTFVVPALAAGVGMALTGAGIGSLTSTIAPVAYPEESNPNPFASGLSGGGCINGLMSFTGVMIGLVFALPILLAIARSTDGEVPLLIGIVIGAPVYGAVVWAGSTTLAGKLLDRRLPSILTELSRA